MLLVEPKVAYELRTRKRLKYMYKFLVQVQIKLKSQNPINTMRINWEKGRRLTKYLMDF